ncbi:MAG: DUF1194 domain-containing protein [Acidimicrobiia bacterium]
MRASLRDAFAGLLRCFAAVAVISLFSLAAPAQAPRPAAMELVLAIDVSTSVDAEEFALQMRGIAAAFRHPDVVAAIARLGERGLAVTLVQWSGARIQRTAVGWTLIRDAAGAGRFAVAVEAAPRQLHGLTSLGGAIRYSLAALEANGFDGRREIIDVSGDGHSGLSPARERDRALARGVVINGLAILSEQPDLAAYFAGHVIGGEGAFVLTADSYADFADAIRDKLIQEMGVKSCC